MPLHIVAADGKPFRDKDAAALKKENLEAQLGEGVELDIVPHLAGGFIIERRQLRPVTAEPHASSDFAEAGTRVQSTPFNKKTSAAAGMTSMPSVDWNREKDSTNKGDDREQNEESQYPLRFSLNPSVHAFPTRLLLSVCGLIFMLKPASLFGVFHIGLPDSPEKASFILYAVSLLSFAITMYGMVRLMWVYMANSYMIDENGVEMSRWYFKGAWPRRHRTRLEYIQIRTLDVDQGLLQTILLVGNVRIASGGTDTYEIELQYIYRPKRLIKEIQRRIALAATVQSVQKRRP
jgi:Bacterial PH domain